MQIASEEAGGEEISELTNGVEHIEVVDPSGEAGNEGEGEASQNTSKKRRKRNKNKGSLSS